MNDSLRSAPLGKKSAYPNQYDPDLLYPIARKIKRDEISVPDPLPFFGYDIWNAFELSWLNLKGKPEVAIAVFEIPCASENIIESKSFKLYLNSFNNSQFSSSEKVRQVLEKDLESATGACVSVKLYSPTSADIMQFGKFSGTCLDLLDIVCADHSVSPALLKTEDASVSETCYSHLLKSNCLVTGQPDWGSVEISYVGQKINHASLLRYLVSFRNHNEFHEQCVERIFMDIMGACQPRELTVYARYTRRGGLDINPVRSTQINIQVCNKRLARQ